MAQISTATEGNLLRLYDPRDIAVTELPTEEDVVRFVTSSRPRKSGAQRFADLKSALRLHRDEGIDLMERLSRRPEYTVRAWTTGVAADVYGNEAIPLLLRLVDDHYEIVRACALTPLLNIAPEAAQGVVGNLRDRLRRHRPDVLGHRRDDPAEAGQLIWALARLKAKEALGEIRAYTARPDSDPYHVRLASVVSTYLEVGEQGLAQRLLEHDHEHVPRLCQVTWRCCAGDAPWRAMASLYRSKELDPSCQLETAVFLAAKKVAASVSKPPFWAVAMPDIPPR